MNKIICDICGTTYPSTAEACPICGYTNESAAELLKNELDNGSVYEKSGRSSNSVKKKEIFDFDEANPEDAEEEYEDADSEEYDDEEEQDEDEGESHHNVFVIILLTVLIVILLAAAGLIFLRFFLPNMKKNDTPVTVPTTEAVITETTEATIPCEQMVMTNAGVAELNAEGQQFLLHVKALPENTTDKIIYTSGDESIATVTENGKITAVSEGETVIHISCGEYYIGCPVIVKYVTETVPPTTEAPVETTAETTVATEPATRSDVTLKLKKTDIRLGVYYEFQLELDCDLKPEEVTWSSEHPHIATVDEMGNVTAVKDGTTSITAKYGQQEVQCIVRCGWY